MDKLFFKIILFHFFFISIHTVNANDYEDSLALNISEIFFSDSTEKELFSDIMDGSDDYLKAFYLSCNPDYQENEYLAFSNSVNELEEYLRSKNIISKNAKKQIKLIHGEVHDKFFSKYQEIVDFYELGRSGIYNCVTASALYAILLNRFEIPYTIKESPQHVFILSYPNSFKILLESTDPLKGYKAYKDDYKAMFVQSLWKNKLISDAEYKAGNTEQLFEKYFFPEGNLTLKELLSIHYLNNAIDLAGKEFYDEAFEQIKKAYVLFPSEKTFFMLFQMNLTVLENAKYDSEKDQNNLLFLSKFIDKGISSDDIANEFARIAYENLVEKYDPEHLTAVYQKFNSEIKNEKLKNDIEYIYHYERGRVLLNKGRYLESMLYTKKAFSLHPENSDAQINFINSLIQNFVIKGFTPLDMAKIDSVADHHPEIMQNNNFIRLKGLYYGAGTEDSFKNGLPAMGNSLLEKFENMVTNYPHVKIDEDLIGRVYSEAAVFYFKRGYTTKAKDLLRKGLALAPNSKELQMRKAMLEY